MRIVCTVGPNIKYIDKLIELSRCGMDTARINMSHADKDESAELISSIRTCLPEMDIIADLQGHKIRVSRLFPGEVSVSVNSQVIFCPEIKYNKLAKTFPKTILIPVMFEGDFKKLLLAKTIYMKDATMEFAVKGSIKEDIIAALVVKGGVIRQEKGLNFPKMDRSGLGLSKKDKEDISWALSNKIDIICLSFVTCQAEVNECRLLVGASSKKECIPKIWAKIETQEGLDNIDEILNASDGIMLGRGDLSAEVGVLDLPKYQDMLLVKMSQCSKELIIATYVLETMKHNKVPSVAECLDIYHSLKQNVSGFMLAGEVGIGKHPLEAITALKALIERYSHLGRTPTFML